MSPSSASVKILLSPFWFRSARPFMYTLKRTGESCDPCGRPIVSWRGAELQFPSCILVFVLRSRASVSKLHCINAMLEPMWNGPIYYISHTECASVTVRYNFGACDGIIRPFHMGSLVLMISKSLFNIPEEKSSKKENKNKITAVTYIYI